MGLPLQLPLLLLCHLLLLPLCRHHLHLLLPHIIQLYSLEYPLAVEAGDTIVAGLVSQELCGMKVFQTVIAAGLETGKFKLKFLKKIKKVYISTANPKKILKNCKNPK